MNFLIYKNWRQNEINEHNQISSWWYKYTEIISNDFKIQNFYCVSLEGYTLKTKNSDNKYVNDGLINKNRFW